MVEQGGHDPADVVASHAGLVGRGPPSSVGLPGPRPGRGAPVRCCSMDPDRPAYSEVDECTSWALAAQGGDAGRRTAFIRATQAETWRFVASLVDPESADDLTQETYLRAFRALPAFEAGPAPVPGCSVSPGARVPITSGRRSGGASSCPAPPRWSWPCRPTARTRRPRSQRPNCSPTGGAGGVRPDPGARALLRGGALPRCRSAPSDPAWPGPAWRWCGSWKARWRSEPTQPAPRKTRRNPWIGRGTRHRAAQD